MDIIIPFGIRKKELGGVVSDEAKKIFEKMKERPQLAVIVASKGLPERTTLHKVYATTPDGSRRLLFFVGMLRSRHRLKPAERKVNQRSLLLHCRPSVGCCCSIETRETM